MQNQLDESLSRKVNGAKRPVGIPTVGDRIIQAATKRILEPIFEQKFIVVMDSVQFVVLT
ncbi:hypothetical protein [Bacillus sp. 1NLA3E]|uniref:hypothetical protein n=1 Tax=Bacillus sp. 1NLA3E TaxID=666686 RepID=UPI0002FD5BED|nr:hypothetical protein [Bacillus sp. 1NLA3E]